MDIGQSVTLSPDWQKQKRMTIYQQPLLPFFADFKELIKVEISYLS